MKGIKKITALILATVLMFTASTTAFAQTFENHEKKEVLIPDGGVFAMHAYKTDTATEEKLWDGPEIEFTDENGVKHIYQNKKNYIVSSENPNYLYRLDDEGNASIAYSYYGEKAYDEIIIPSTIDGYNITRIDAFAFYMCNGISGIRIPDTVKEVGYYAFGYCSQLERLIIGTGVEVFNAEALVGSKTEKEVCFASSEEQADEIMVWSYKNVNTKKACDWTKLNGNNMVSYDINTDELLPTTRISERSLWEWFREYIKEMFEMFRDFFTFLFSLKGESYVR